MGSGPPQHVREVTIERPNIQTSFGFVLQSNTLRPGCMICRLVPNSPAELCNQLYVYDELLAVNGKDVSQVDHNDIVTLVKSSGTSIKLAVQEPEGYTQRMSCEQEHVFSSEPFPVLEIRLVHQVSGFGFRIIGGKEGGTQATVSEVVEGGAADLDGRLIVGDEITYINGVCVIDASHREVISLMGEAAAQGEVVLSVRRKMPLPELVSPLQAPPQQQEAMGSGPPQHVREVTIERPNIQTSFGFVLQSNTLRPGCMICRLVPNSPAELCNQLYVYDELLAVNGKDVSQVDHNDIVTLVKSSGTSIKLAVQEPEVAGTSIKLAVQEPEGYIQRMSREQEHVFSSEPFTVLEIRLMRQVSGFGFRIIGGKEEGSQATVDAILEGGAADLDGRLIVGDEITHVNGVCVIDASHREVISLMGEAAAQGEVVLGICRKMPSPGIEYSNYPYQYEGELMPQISPNLSDIVSDDEEIHHIDIHRDGQEFGFSIRGGAEYNAPLCVLRIAEGGAAERDNRLKSGDELLEINGYNTEDMLHSDAITIIRHGGHVVKLKLRRVTENPFIRYGTVDHRFQSGHSYSSPSSRPPSSLPTPVAGVFTRATVIVLYIGQVVLPESWASRGPSSRCIQECTRRLLSKRSQFFEVFLEISALGMNVSNAERNMTFNYKRDELYYCGVCTYDEQYFSVMTQKMDQKSHKKETVHSDIKVQDICHVFKVVQGKSVLYNNNSNSNQVGVMPVTMISGVTIINAMKGIFSGKSVGKKDVVDLRPGSRHSQVAL